MIKGYIKSRWLFFSAVVWNVIVFGVIAVVTPEAASVIAFGIFISVCVCGMTLRFDLKRYMEKCRKMQVICDHIGSAPVDFGKAPDPVEQYYQTAAAKLLQQSEQTLQQMALDYREHTEYYSMWVHQIKTPIAALRMMVQSDGRITGKGAYYAEIFRIEQYVDMVLQYMRLKNTSGDMEIARTDVYALVRESVKKFSPVWMSKHLSVDIPFFDQIVYTNEKWLAFMLEQFIANSLKYSDQGCIHIFGKYEGRQWELRIRDEGIGICSEDIPRIFEKGYTGHNGRIYKKSAGIGLYLAKNAADRLGLGLEVSSEINKGTMVRIIFPEDILG